MTEAAREVGRAIPDQALEMRGPGDPVRGPGDVKRRDDVARGAEYRRGDRVQAHLELLVRASEAGLPDLVQLAGKLTPVGQRLWRDAVQRQRQQPLSKCL